MVVRGCLSIPGSCLQRIGKFSIYLCFCELALWFRFELTLLRVSFRLHKWRRRWPHSSFPKELMRMYLPQARPANRIKGRRTVAKKNIARRSPLPSPRLSHFSSFFARCLLLSNLSIAYSSSARAILDKSIQHAPTYIYTRGSRACTRFSISILFYNTDLHLFIAAGWNATTTTNQNQSKCISPTCMQTSMCGHFMQHIHRRSTK